MIENQGNMTEEMNKTNIIFMKFTKILLILWICAVMCVMCTQSSKVKELKRVEVKDYKGAKLSELTDFRENSIAGPQHINKNLYKLKVTGLAVKPNNYSYDEVIKNFAHYKKVVELDCVEGWKVNIAWEGMLMSDIIKSAEPLPEAKVVILKAQDGYSTSFPLDYFLNKDILLAYRKNDIILPEERGFPFQLVAENKWGYKWIKWVNEIEFSQDANYKGYWESKGYSNSGNLNEDFVEK